MSTGIGAGTVIDGEVLEGVDGLAGEVGHLLVEPDGAACLCGRRGCAETVASGPAIARRAERRARAQPRLAPVLRPRLGAGLRLTAEDVAEAASKGDSAASQTLEDAGHVIAMLVSVLIVVVHFVVALGGGVSYAGQALWGTLERELGALTHQDVTTIVRRAASREAPLWGAFTLGERAASDC